jgi:hypothetical protein
MNTEILLKWETTYIFCCKEFIFPLLALILAICTEVSPGALVSLIRETYSSRSKRRTLSAGRPWLCLLVESLGRMTWCLDEERFPWHLN